MPSITGTDLMRMRDGLWFEQPNRARKISRFWMLLVLAAVIAAAGVVGDSTATVIGAMIVAPLMTPILGTVLAMVVADRVHLGRSIGAVVLGAATVVAIAWAVGLFVRLPVVAATNSQVASRVHPHIVDLVAALATGAVGAFALVRDDISDTLPGVAIAISLVPPLAVVGLTLESGAPGQAVGALLLFVTNVVAILMSGMIVMLAYRVHRTSERELVDPSTGRPRATGNRRAGVLTVVVMLVVIVIPLAATSVVITNDTLETSSVTSLATSWAERSDWQVLSVAVEPDGVQVRVSGPPPGPDPRALRQELDANGLGDVEVVLSMVPERRVDLRPD